MPQYTFIVTLLLILTSVYLVALSPFCCVDSSLIFNFGQYLFVFSGSTIRYPVITKSRSTSEIGRKNQEYNRLNQLWQGRISFPRFQAQWYADHTTALPFHKTTTRKSCTKVSVTVYSSRLCIKHLFRSLISWTLKIKLTLELSLNLAKSYYPWVSYFDIQRIYGIYF